MAQSPAFVLFAVFVFTTRAILKYTLYKSISEFNFNGRLKRRILANFECAKFECDQCGQRQQHLQRQELRELIQKTKNESMDYLH